MKDLAIQEINSKIHTFRGKQVMVDSGLALLYGVETKVLNQAVKRNIERFPEEFMFKLNDYEKNELVTNCDHLKYLKFSSQNPYVFTEQGVAMFSSVLRSDTAVKVSIQIMNAFVAMRKFLSKNVRIFERLNHVERKHLEYDKNFEKIFDALETHEPKQGIFYDGQVFDAYKFVLDLISSANHSITLIDNYVDETTLMLFSERKTKVSVNIYTKNITNKLKLDLKKFNEQYNSIEIKEFNKSHDRFLIIDDQIYHFGASLKDLGKKWFAFSKLNLNLKYLLKQLN